MVDGSKLKKIEIIFIKYLAEVMNKYNVHLTVVLISCRSWKMTNTKIID